MKCVLMIVFGSNSYNDKTKKMLESNDYEVTKYNVFKNTRYASSILKLWLIIFKVILLIVCRCYINTQISGGKTLILHLINLFYLILKRDLEHFFY